MSTQQTDQEKASRLIALRDDLAVKHGDIARDLVNGKHTMAKRAKLEAQQQETLKGWKQAEADLRKLSKAAK